MGQCIDCSSFTIQGFERCRPVLSNAETIFLSVRNSLFLHSYTRVASGCQNREVMADAHCCSSSGLDKGPNGGGEVTRFLSATRSFRNLELQNDATTSSTGEHSYYSTAPQELWTELLSKDLQDLDFGPKIQNAGVSGLWEHSGLCASTIEHRFVHKLRQSDLLLLQLLAEGGQAHVYFAECKKFSVPVVVKRLKHGNVNLYKLLHRMEMVMKTRAERKSAICRVFGVGEDFVGNVWVVMERLAGDLRTLIDRRMSYLEDGEMPFDYNNTITMMLSIAQGMEDLHRCDLIHADLKASNILVTPESIGRKGEDVDGLQQASESMEYFYVKIADFELSDNVVGTGFWRAPEVLQALRNKAKPILSPAVDVYSYGMLCFELLTGHIPFEEYRCSNFDVIFSGQRPELPTHVNLTMRELLHGCWRTESRERPTWSYIINILTEELRLHGWRQSRKCAKARILLERGKIKTADTPSETSNLVETSWEEVVAQGLGTEKFTKWKEKVVPEILPEILPIVEMTFERRKAKKQDTYDSGVAASTIMGDSVSKLQVQVAFHQILCAFDKAWDVVIESRFLEIFGPQRLEEGEIKGKKDTERMVRKMCANLLGPTAKCWLNEVLTTSEEWKTFRATLNAWRSENESISQWWKEKLQTALFTWEKFYGTLHAWHVKSPISAIAWQAVKTISDWREETKLEENMNSVCREDMNSECRENTKLKVRQKCELHSTIRSCYSSNC